MHKLTLYRKYCVSVLPCKFYGVIIIQLTNNIFYLSRTLDIKAKKHHVPVVDRTPVEPPPILVAVVGPPKVGKTTLIQCLIKNFTKQKLNVINGPVTIVSGECSKIALKTLNTFEVLSFLW